MTASWWQNECFVSRPPYKKNPTLSSNWVVSHLPAVSVLHYEMCTNGTNGCGERPWLIFVNSFDSYVEGEVLMQMNGVQMSRPDRRGSEWLLLLLLFSMCDRGWRNQSCNWAKNSWTSGMEKAFCFVIVPLGCCCSCVTLFKHLSSVHLLRPPTSCFAVVILILIVSLRGWSVVKDVYVVVRYVDTCTWKQTVKILMVKLCGCDVFTLW